MAARVDAVAGIAERKRGRKVKLASAAYLAATRARVPSPASAGAPLEGFLFPATYDFTARTTSPSSWPNSSRPSANWAK